MCSRFVISASAHTCMFSFTPLFYHFHWSELSLSLAMLHANDAPNTALPFVLWLVLLLMHAERCCGYTMSISSYGSVIPAKVLWDGGGSLAVLNLSGSRRMYSPCPTLS